MKRPFELESVSNAVLALTPLFARSSKHGSLAGGPGVAAMVPGASVFLVSWARA